MASIEKVALAFVFALGTGLAAQDPAKPHVSSKQRQDQRKLDIKKKAKPKGLKRSNNFKFRKNYKKITSRIKQQKALMDKEGVITSHIKVRVSLRNGESLQGVVKNGVFVEKSTRYEFVRSEMSVKGAGLRLWYYNGTDGYIFLPYLQIKTYRIVKQLSEIEVTAIRDSIREREAAAKAAADARRKLLAEKRAARDKDHATGKKLEELSKKAAEGQKTLEEGKKLLDLIAEFPPSDGWGPKKIKQLQDRKINLGIFPNATETRFIENFERWEKGFAMWKALNPEKAKELEKSSEEGSSTGSKKGSSKKN